MAATHSCMQSSARKGPEVTRLVPPGYAEHVGQVRAQHAELQRLETLITLIIVSILNVLVEFHVMWMTFFQFL